MYNYIYILYIYIYLVNTIYHIASSINRMASPSKTPGLRDGQVLGGCQDLGGSQMARDLRDLPSGFSYGLSITLW